jgi:L-lactate dehydrogenase complex protein LldF
VYRQTGGHAYGSTYSGPIGAVITPLLKGDENAKDLPHASSLCGACSETCPVGIPLHDLLLKLRNRQVEKGMASKPQRAAFKVFENTMKSPALYNISTRAARLAQKPLLREGGDSLRPVPGPMSGWTERRDLPPLAKKSFRELWKEGI